MSPSSRLLTVLVCTFLSLLSVPDASGDEGRIFTLWPLVDYRASKAAEYSNLNLLGPLLKYERKGSEEEFAFRPLVYHARDGKGNSLTDLFYPVSSRKGRSDSSSFQALRLLQVDSSEVETEEQFMLFPFLFSGYSRDKKPFFAFFPLGGRLYDRFGKDEIRFTLFPLYSRTQHAGTTVTHILWPVYSRTQGEDESGIKLWPIYGAADREGVYRKRFFLWPIFFRQDLALNTDNPRFRRAVFPFYFEEVSTRTTSRTWLWPFFSHVENTERGYEEWNFPWPLLRRTQGTYREGVRVLPFFADERTGDYRRRWYLWPLYRIEETRTDLLERRRDRLVYFLYSDLREKVLEEAHGRRRVALWPLFTYERRGGVSHFMTLSLLEPFFPENEGIERNWAPLWRLYQRKWDAHGNRISSLLWNLYWKERRGSDFAMEIFPLVSYRREEREGTDLSVLKGLARFRSGPEGRKIHLLYLPWGLPLGGTVESTEN